MFSVRSTYLVVIRDENDRIDESHFLYVRQLQPSTTDLCNKQNKKLEGLTQSWVKQETRGCNAGLSKTIKNLGV